MKQKFERSWLSKRVFIIFLRTETLKSGFYPVLAENKTGHCDYVTINHDVAMIIHELSLFFMYLMGHMIVT